MRRKVAAGAAAGVALITVLAVGVAGAATGTGPGGAMADALAGLVSDGTITQDQADKVEDALTTARQEARADRQDRIGQRQAAVDQVLQDVLGLSRDQVTQRLIDGATVGEIVGDKGDELATAFQALVQQRLDEAVASSRLTQAQADTIAAQSRERLEAAFTAGSDLMQAKGLAGLGMLARQHAAHGFGGMGMGFGHRGGRGHGGPPSYSGQEPSATSGTSSTA